MIWSPPKGSTSQYNCTGDSVSAYGFWRSTYVQIIARSLNWRYQHALATCQKCRFSEPRSTPTDQNLNFSKIPKYFLCIKIWEAPVYTMPSDPGRPLQPEKFRVHVTSSLNKWETEIQSEKRTGFSKVIQLVNIIGTEYFVTVKYNSL